VSREKSPIIIGKVKEYISACEELWSKINKNNYWFY
jgi:hypothetical protein